MKNLAIKKRIERKKAKSRRAIQAFWLAKAKEALNWCVEAEADLNDAYDDPFGCLDESPANHYGYEWHIEEARKALEKYKQIGLNALCRYEQAIAR